MKQSLQQSEKKFDQVKNKAQEEWLIKEQKRKGLEQQANEDVHMLRKQLGGYLQRTDGSLIDAQYA